MYKKLYKKIKKYNTIIIHRHSRPDGDALGSQTGLALALRLNYPKKHIYMVGDGNARLNFFAPMDEIDDIVYKEALVIICDVAVSSMVSDDRYKLAKEVFIIDHHTNKSDIEQTNLMIDSTRSACAEYIADFLYTKKFKVNSDIATALYAGIVTDSGRFQYAETNPRTFLVASLLLSSGARIQEIYDKLYVETLESKKLKATFANRFEVTKHQVAYMFNTKEFMEESKLDFSNVSRGMVNVMSGIEGINIWANFTYDASQDKVIGEFRSRGFSIVDIAKKYGGGGHDQACGATLDNFEVAKQVLNDFDERMKEHE